jgi:hypothetical protein
METRISWSIMTCVTILEVAHYQDGWLEAHQSRASKGFIGFFKDSNQRCGTTRAQGI